MHLKKINDLIETIKNEKSIAMNKHTYCLEMGNITCKDEKCHKDIAYIKSSVKEDKKYCIEHVGNVNDGKCKAYTYSDYSKTFKICNKPLDRSIVEGDKVCSDCECKYEGCYNKRVDSTNLSNACIEHCCTKCKKYIKVDGSKKCIGCKCTFEGCDNDKKDYNTCSRHKCIMCSSGREPDSDVCIMHMCVVNGCNGSISANSGYKFCKKCSHDNDAVAFIRNMMSKSVKCDNYIEIIAAIPGIKHPKELIDYVKKV